MKKKIIITLAVIGVGFLTYDIVTASANGYNTTEKMSFKQCLDFMFGNNQDQTPTIQQPNNNTQTQNLTEQEMNQVIEQYFNSSSQRFPCH